MCEFDRSRYKYSQEYQFVLVSMGTSLDNKWIPI